MKISYIGKTILLESNESILVVGDLHLGFGEVMREGGVFVPVDLFKDLLKEFDSIFDRIGFGEKKKLDKIILLGDLKHEFGKILRDEWNEVSEIFDYFCKRTHEVIVVKGNHDKIIEPIARKKKISVFDFYISGENAFFHGDKKFDEMNYKRIKRWFMGHAHPAITLSDGNKKEKYKCFLVGDFEGKEIFILPSFFDVNEGTDIKSDYDIGLPWNFDLNKFSVKIVGENLEVLDFGQLSKLG